MHFSSGLIAPVLGPGPLLSSSLQTTRHSTDDAQTHGARGFPGQNGTRQIARRQAKRLCRNGFSVGWFGSAPDKLMWHPARFCFLIALALVSPLLATGTGQARSALPCARNANQAARYCATICRIAKRFALAACVPRDEACVASCKTHLSGCRDP